MCVPKKAGGLGFRDMEKFNFALVAKQGWRMLKQQDTVAYKVLKHKYFPNSTFLEAGIGNNHSLMWRSIWNTQEFLRKGLRWRVGRGEQIKIWKDPWLAINGKVQVIAHREGLTEDARVCEIIDNVNGQWNWNLIQNLFTPTEIDAIRSIPICKRRSQDVMIWWHDFKGAYSVKSGYRVLSQEGPDTLGSPSPNVFGDDNDWYKIWAAEIPNKIKVLIWRCLKEILPVRMNLLKRKIISDPACFRCGKEPETVLHAIKDCEVAMDVWRTLFPNNVDSWSSLDTTGKWIFNGAANNGADYFSLFLVGIWTIWTNRNHELHGTPRKTAPVSACFAKDYLFEFKKAQQRSHVQGQRMPGRWKTPLSDMVKVNFDGAFDKSQKRGGIGVVIRDSQGHVVGAATSNFDNVFDSWLIEYQATIKALEMAALMGFQRVVLEGDALGVIKALCSSLPDLSIYGTFVEEARSLLTTFLIASVAHVMREGNMAAHKLAKFALSSSSPLVWTHCTPSCITEIVDQECTDILLC